jgi:hypothetical protein
LSKDDQKVIAKVEEGYQVKVGTKAAFSFDPQRAFVFDSNKKVISTVSPSGQGGN